MDIDNLKRSCKRAYVELKRRAKAINVDRMLTLTFAKNLGKKEKSITDRIFALFVKKCRALFGSFDYVCVPELQKRGAVHYHLGLNRYYNVYLLWETWKQSIIESGHAQSSDKIGSVFINKRAKQAKSGVAAYIAKYIMKSVYNLDVNATSFNGKRYYSSKINIKKLQAIIIKGFSPKNAFLELNLYLKEQINSDFSQKMISLHSVFEQNSGVMGYKFAFFQGKITDLIGPPF